MVKYVNSISEFESLVAASTDKLLVVDFTASWCGPCQMIAPILEKMSEEYPNVTFIKVDVDEADEIAGKCGIRAMPTFHFYKGGQKVEQFEGASAPKLQELVKKYA